MICGGRLGLKAEACSIRERSTSSLLDLESLQDAEVCRLRMKLTNNAIHIMQSCNSSIAESSRFVQRLLAVRATWRSRAVSGSPKHSRPTDQQTASHLWDAKYVILCNLSTEMPSKSAFLNQAVIVVPQKATLRLNASDKSSEVEFSVILKPAPPSLFYTVQPHHDEDGKN